MPLVETVSLLTALASAYQSIRASRSPHEIPSPSAVDVPDPALLLSHEIARASYDSSLQRARDVSRWAFVIEAFACLALLGAALVALAVDDLGVSAPLLVAVVFFMLQAAAAASVLLHAGDLVELGRRESSLTLEDLVKTTDETARTNEAGNQAARRRLAACLIFGAAQVAATAVWLAQA